MTLDHLGESVSTLAEAAEARDVYLRTLAAIHTNGIQGNVSLKLTQFGLDLSYEQCLANVEQLVRRAAELGSFVRVDMESSDYTDRTLDLVHTPARPLWRGRRGHPELPAPQRELMSRSSAPPRSAFVCAKAPTSNPTLSPSHASPMWTEATWNSLAICSRTASTPRSPRTMRP